MNATTYTVVWRDTIGNLGRRTEGSRFGTWPEALQFITEVEARDVTVVSVVIA